MNRYKKILFTTITIVTLSGCANMTSQQKNTSIGAAVGGVAGAALTGGSSVGTVGGAIVGGVIGNQVKR